MKKMMAVIFAGLLASANAGNTLIVDKTGAGGAYTTIQAAIDAADAKDTIYIKDGVYDEGSTNDNFTVQMQNRVFIWKDITLIGESRKGTIIKGAKATVAEDTVGLGLGADAVRCVGIAADNVVISNLTITGGATHRYTAANDQTDNNGGGIYASTGSSRDILVVDCDIVNNVARRAGAARYADDVIARFRMTFARCFFHYNRAENRCAITRGCQLVYCLLTRHPCQACAFYACKAVNCTFADDRCRSYGENDNCKFYNCLFAGSMYKADSPAYYYNCGFTAPEADCDTGKAYLTDCVYSIGYDHFVSPITGDYRLYDGATKAINKGSYSHLAEITREDCRYIDFAGNAVTSGTTMHLGCHQGTPVTPAYGKIQFANIWDSDATGTYGFNLSPKVYFSYNDDPDNWFFIGALCYSRVMTWPGIVKLTIDNQDTGKVLGYFGFTATGADTVMRYPYLDETYEFAAPRDASKTLTLTPVKADSIVYVEQNSQAATEDGSKEAPYKDLQTGINAIASGKNGIVYCNGGTFDSNECTSYSGLNNRIFDNGRNVRIVGVGGWTNNVIVGAADSTVAKDVWPFGCGANAVRCVCLAKTSVLQGFTLTGGYCNPADGTGKRGSGAWISGNSQILDCVITNNWGCQGPAINSAESGQSPYAYAFRCYVDGNHQFGTSSGSLDGSGSGLLRSLHAGMFIMGPNNTGNVASWYECQDFHHFTYFFSGNGNYTGLSGNETNYNSVIYSTAKDITINGRFVNSVCYAKKDALILIGSTCKKTDPLLAGPTNGDYRLGAVSEARNCGGYSTDYYGCDNFHIFVMRDFYGNAYRVDADGKPLCGAVQAFAPTVIVKNTGDAEGISGSFGTNVLSGTTSSLTYTAAKAQTRPYLGMEITNGGVVTTNRTETYTYNVPASTDYSVAYEFSAKALYDTNWYVTKSGKDTNWGTEDSPKLTLKGALDYATSGDKVYVGAGEYDSNPMSHTGSISGYTYDSTVKSRAYVPAGVELIGEGAETTFIVGADDPDETNYGGCGSNAVRCVTLAANAKLKGFTLKDGRAGYLKDNSDNEFGGGVLAYFGSSKLPTIEDCVITNCMARRGAGGFDGAYNRCKIIGNSVVNGGNGAAVRGEGSKTCYLYNSIIDGNTGYGVVYVVAAIHNCTFGSNNNSPVRDCYSIYNTLFLKGGDNQDIALNEGNTGHLYNCAYGPDEAARFASHTKYTVLLENCKEADSYDNLAMDGFSPVVGANVAVDSADDSFYAEATYGDKDVAGNPRKVNGLKLDVGAVEADWKAAYSAALGRHVTVSAADPEVELVDTKVKIPANAALSLAMSTEVDGKYRFNVTVADDATLTADKDGAAWKSITSSGKQDFVAANESTTFDFSVGSVGSAYLSRFAPNRGLLMLIK